MSTVPELIARGNGRLVKGETGAAVPLAERVQHVAGTLAARGFGAGDVLALQAPNIPPWAGVALGAMAAGGSVTGIHPAATDREVAAQRAAAGASMLMTMADLPGLLALPTAPVETGPGPDTTALLPFSSGTTGTPKPVRLTHRHLTAAMRQVQEALRLTREDVVLALPPFCHVMGFVVTLAAPLAAGATVVTATRWDPALIDRHKITVLTVPPPLMGWLAHAEQAFPSLELIVSGGAPLAPAVQQAVVERFPHAVVAQGYGMTETAVAISGPSGRRPTPLGSVGVPMADTEVKLVAGELWVRGPQVATDGWLRTGDLAEQDERGTLYIRDRLKDLIKVDAYQVAPGELEALLLEHPLVADAAVVGVPDGRHGEVPVAHVVGDIDPETLRAWVGERVAPYKRLAAVKLTDAIPRTPTGKILRRELRRSPAAALPR